MLGGMLHVRHKRGRDCQGTCPEELDTAIFYMDMRTYGKDFERYYDRAREESGVRFIRSRVHTIVPAAPGSDDLSIQYADEEGQIHSEVFDLVVLSIGIQSSDEARALAGRIGVEINADGFVQTSSFSPVTTSRPGIFTCGVFSGPKDIPDSVMEASAASSASAVLLSGSRNTLTREKTYPPEDPSVHAEPRIGVFVCHCGINIGSVVDVPDVRDYAKDLPDVAYVADNMFTCSQDTQKLIQEAIKEHRLNRVVVAACTPGPMNPFSRKPSARRPQRVIFSNWQIFGTRIPGYTRPSLKKPPRRPKTWCGWLLRRRPCWSR